MLPFSPIAGLPPINSSTTEEALRLGRSMRIKASLLLIGASSLVLRERGLRSLAEAAQVGDPVAIELVEAADRWVGDETANFERRIHFDSPHVEICRQILSRFQCAYLIAAARPLLKPSEIIDGRSGAQLDDPFRISETAIWPSSETDDVVALIARRLAVAFDGLMIDTEPLSVVRYHPGGVFHAHVDAFVGPSSKDGDHVARQTTTIVYLNCDYEGGDTAFIFPKAKFRGGTGDALYFRNTLDNGLVDSRSIHGSLPVTAGEKWVLVQWLRRI